ncbi:MAG: hypothetical protein BGO39_30170 [Chloroflexi bacterium 54-19]|nr:MAG: hypothetical protein BGO39_30170 [Chloroflexi bacterium 54-19]
MKNLDGQFGKGTFWIYLIHSITTLAYKMAKINNYFRKNLSNRFWLKNWGANNEINRRFKTGFFLSFCYNISSPILAYHFLFLR